MKCRRNINSFEFPSTFPTCPCYLTFPSCPCYLTFPSCPCYLTFPSCPCYLTFPICPCYLAFPSCPCYLGGLCIRFVRCDDLQELHLVHGGEVVHTDHLLRSQAGLRVYQGQGKQPVMRRPTTNPKGDNHGWYIG